MQYSAWTGAEVREMRLALGMTQRGLAVQIGTRLASISDWETGKALPSPIFCRILTQFATEVDYFRRVGITPKFDRRYVSAENSESRLPSDSRDL